MIVVTGAAGFIGSVTAGFLIKSTNAPVVLVDDFSREDKRRNYHNKKYNQLIDRELFPSWLAENAAEVGQVIHLGARTDTTEFNVAIFDKLNLNYSKTIWEMCSTHQIPLIYASSAATYGMGEWGYDDNHAVVSKLKPLNPYGESKNDFDKWVLQQKQTPPHWYGLKFFNVYGPNEYHKGRMASVIFHAFQQINKNGSMNLFRSHHPDYADGAQLRDFVYVKDVAEVITFLMLTKPASGLYNLGTGKANTFLNLANATFAALQLSPDIHFVDTPLDIRDKYQYFTEANMEKLREAGYEKAFHNLDDGIKDYVQNYLSVNASF